MCLASFDDDGADGDAEMALLIESEPADGAGVDAPSGGFQLSNDLPGALLGCTGDGATREAGAEGGEMIDLRPQGAFHGRDEMEHLLETLHGQQLPDNDA